MRWGLVPFWAKDAKIGYSTINARAEEAAGKPAYREALKRRRCLVPADAFYEWQRPNPAMHVEAAAKTKQPFAIALRSGEPYAMAGLWERWQPKEGPALESFTILTTGPNELMAPIHNRMPVILAASDYSRWLSPGDPAQPPLELLRPFPAEEMIAWPVCGRVGNVCNNDPQLLDRIQLAEDRSASAG
jgi:putative SOS response-associated peptidase YedK